MNNFNLCNCGCHFFLTEGHCLGCLNNHEKSVREFKELSEALARDMFKPIIEKIEIILGYK